MRNRIAGAIALVALLHHHGVVAELSKGLLAFEDKRYEIAHRELLEAAENSPEAAYHLGLIYDLGLGRTADEKSALEWFLKAAESGHEAGA